MTDLSREENIDIAEHTEYRDPKIWLGVVCLAITILCLSYFMFIRQPAQTVVSDTSRTPVRENSQGADYDYQIDETVVTDEQVVVEVPAVAVSAPVPTTDTDYDDAPLVVYQASGTGSLRETPLYSESDVSISREAQLDQVRELLNSTESVSAGGSEINGNDNSSVGGEAGIRSLSYDKQHGYDPVSPYQIPDQSNVLVAGTIVPAVLDFAIDSSLSGQIRAFTTEHVYSADGSTLLLPKSSQLLGQYSGGVVQGDTRVFFRWERIQIANGVLMDIDTAGMDAIGRSGIGGDVDERFFHKFGAAILLSVIESELEDDEVRINDLSANVSSDLETVISEIVRRRSAIPPIIRVPQGQRINVFVNQDIDFSAFLKQ